MKGRPFNEYYYNKYGRKIVMNYRREKITGPTFKYPRYSHLLKRPGRKISRQSEAAQFLFWEYLFQIFGTVHLQSAVQVIRAFHIANAYFNR